MILRFLISVILIFTLSLRPDCVAYAKSADTIDPKLQFLIQTHNDMKSSNLSMEQIDKSGEYLINETQKYLNDPKNIKSLKTEAGQQLIKHQSLLMNYMAVKKHLEKCVKDSNSKRNLKERVLSTTFQGIKTQLHLVQPCLPRNKTIKTFNDFNNQVMKVMKLQSQGDFLDEMNKQVLKNTMKSLVGLKYKFDPNFMANKYLTQSELNALMSEICFKNSCSRISGQFRQELAKEAIDHSKSLMATEKRFNSISAAQSLNESIDLLNQKLNQIKIKKDSGIIFDSADLSSPESKAQFDEYVQNYMNVVSKDAGVLLLTKEMRESAGEIKSFSDDDTKKEKRSGQFKFIPHKKINAKNIESAVKEAKQKIMSQAQDTEKVIVKEQMRKSNARYIRGDARKEDIDEILKINPVAAGQILTQHPEYAGLVCDSINSLNRKEEKDKEFDHYFMLGSAILGGALLLTGVGTMAGAYLLTGSVTAGIAAGTVGGSIMATTITAGAVVETVNGVYYGKRSYDAYIENNKIEQALLSGNTDGVSITEKKEAYLQFKDARTKASIALISAGLSVARLDKFFDFGRMLVGGLKLQNVKVANQIMKYLSESSVAKKLADTAKLMGGKSAEVIDEFLLRLAKVSENLRLKTLELLKDSKLTPDKLKEVFEKSLEAAKKCAKS